MCALGNRISDVCLNLFNGMHVDKRPLLGFPLESVPHFEFADCHRQPFYKGIVDVVLNKETVGTDTGQTCVCTNRFLVQDNIYDAFVKRLAVAVSKLKVGDGLKGETQQGPLIDMHAVKKIEAHIADAVAKGAHVVAGGERHELGGSFFQPTILVDVTPDMLVAREETFGPLAPIFHFSTEKEAIELANDTEFGLAAYFYSRDIGRVWRVAEALEYGIIGINAGLMTSTVATFGGMKESGVGREGSKYGVEDYLEIKYLCMGGI